jgi:hypothetical protein
LRGAEELSLAVQSVADLQRVDAEEFTRAGGAKPTVVQRVSFLKTDFASSECGSRQPQIETVVRNNVASAQIRSSLSVIDYTIKRAGVFALKSLAH